MADMLHVTEETFKTEVLDSTQPVLVDFSAVWCQPSARETPLLTPQQAMGPTATIFPISR